MTLIARTMVQNVPVLLSDHLITSKQGGLTEIPSSVRILTKREEANGKYLPCSLTRKVYIITPNIAVALAGVVSTMKGFLEDLRMHFRYHENSLENLQKFMSNSGFVDNPNISSEDLSVIISHCEVNVDTAGERRLTEQVYGIGVHSAHTPSFGEVFMAGSGIEIFKREVSIPYGSDDMEFGNAQKNNRTALKLNYALINTLLIREYKSATTLADYFGGHYELVYYNGDEFARLDELTSYFFEGTLRIDERTPFDLHHVVSTRYYDDKLCLNHWNPEYQLSLRVDSLEYEGPIDDFDFDLNSKHSTLGLAVTLPNNELVTPSILVLNESFFTCDFEEGKLNVKEINVDKRNEIMGYLLNPLKEHFSNESSE